MIVLALFSLAASNFAEYRTQVDTCVRQYSPIMNSLHGTINAVPSYQFDISTMSGEDKVDLMHRGLFGFPVKYIVTYHGDGLQNDLTGEWQHPVPPGGRVIYKPGSALYEVTSPRMLNYEQLSRQLYIACGLFKRKFRLTAVSIDFDHSGKTAH